MKDIAFLDTDFFNKTLKVTNLEGDSLLEKTLSLNYDFYICQKVFKELRKQSLSKAKELIDLGKIKLYKFEDCLKNLYAKNKTIAFIQFLLDLEFIIENMFATNQLYLEKFQHLESLCSNNNITVVSFLRSLNVL